ncbi:hypothetical protein F4780DRAFT_739276 [Xylariomycetidae sp. FL0641]|nr:hypothetical protein F4780DRAFT_739276 [Xylariomycetidae sp. FL0641]
MAILATSFPRPHASVPLNIPITQPAPPAMQLKRKRSDASMASSSSPVAPAATASDAVMLDAAASPTRPPPSRTTAHLNSRTRKRFRGGRPSETEVHQRTLDLLYTGARRPPSPLPTPEAEAAETAELPPPTRAQPSLHSFWKLPSHPAPETARCECRRDPDDAGAMDVDMDDGSGAAAGGCGACSRGGEGAAAWGAGFAGVGVRVC